MKRFLVCVDGSPRGALVLETAAGLAQRSGAKLVLFRAVGIPVGMPSEIWKESDQSVLEILNETATKYLAECAATLPPQIVERSLVHVGTPWQAVCDAAKETRADLIVIGSHGYGGLDRILGTTAAKIVNHAECSVLVVRAPLVEG